MDDQHTTVLQLRELVAGFVRQRQWEGYHAPKNLAMAMAIECAELMEHFQWLTVEESRRVAENSQQLQAVGEELADVVSYALAMANSLGLDVSRLVESKMQKNASKYPI